MKSVTITEIHEGQSRTAEFLRSEDCGYRAGSLLLDMPNGDSIQISKYGRKYCETRIRDRIGMSSVLHDTKSEACQSAATELFGEQITNELSMK